MLQRKHLLWILFFGSLIGLHETFTGSFGIPYRSVVLNSITIVLLTLARFKMPFRGSSLAVIAVALLFKMNHAGFQTCTTAWFLCGPTALLSIGIMYELSASLISGKKVPGYARLALVCSLTALAGFALFGAVSTFVTGDWDLPRFAEYIYLKALLAAAISGLLSMLALYVRHHVAWELPAGRRPALYNSLLGTVILAFWLIGTFAN
jgi:hypothetical protein